MFYFLNMFENCILSVIPMLHTFYWKNNYALVGKCEFQDSKEKS